MTKLTLIPVTKAFSAVVDRLRELPENHDEIADIMATFGITGHCKDPDECVLARYAADALDVDTVADISVSVHSGEVVVEFGDFTLVWDLPFHLETFTRKFDKGKYPHLISGNDDA